jgi:hypothetical protein
MDSRKRTDAAIYFGGVITTARWQEHAEQLEKSFPPREKSREEGRPYNRKQREVDQRRVGGGRVRSSDELE